MEGADIQQGHRDPAEIIHNAKDCQRKAKQKTGQMGNGIREVLGPVVFFAGFDLIDLFVHLAVHIKDGIGRLKDNLDGGFRGIDAEGAFDRHDNFNVVAGIDPSTDNKTVDPRHPGDSADIGGDQEMQNPDAFVALHTELTEHTVKLGDLKGFLIMDIAVIALGHDIGDKLCKTGERAKQAPFFPVTHTTATGCSHNMSS